ncbi:MAG: exodeoxyribonuclease V subunit gamma [Actinomycetota bacterium]|nr:exodeoxyribonuclease V subunit gamma [Actinomycetota bacterium]
MIHVHRAERADGLVQALASLLAEPIDDPFVPEVVAVPTRGMERWLSQRLSASLGASPDRADGICANVLFPSPRRLARDAIAAASGIDPQADPWAPERAVWRLLEVVEGALREPWLRVLSAHIGCGADPPDEALRARRLPTVRHLAELFDRYALYRPEMVLSWASGADTDGWDEALPADCAWQAELWRELRRGIALPGPAERLERACARLRDDPSSSSELPPRISLFGLTRLPAGDLRVLRALAAHRDVHLFLLHPSPALWQAIADRTAGAPQIVRRRGDWTVEVPRNRLLASWGRDAREMQLVLGHSGDHVDHHHPVRFGEAMLLERIQQDVRADRQPPGSPPAGHDDPRPVLDPRDRSIQVHACHGRARQVEVLRDAVLHLLAADETLEPRDVIVMCPDVESFAPLIQATFGAGELSADSGTTDADPLASAPQAGDLRVRLADRSLRQTNPVLGVIAELLDLVSQRVTASQVLDLADRDPVRRRFRLSDEDLTRLQAWVTDSGIHWGLDGAHRASFKLAHVPAGTWRTGLERVLLGVTMTEDRQRLFERVLPLDDVDGAAIDLAGRFAELIARLAEAIGSLALPKPIGVWARAISVACDALTATSPRDAWQRSELQRLLDEVVEEASLADSRAELALGEARALLAERLAGRPTRANFRTGHLTVCTLYPMRSVPHRVVCLLGLDDEAFPRKAPRDGDDLMLADPHVGERDPRSEDRQLLLDALLAATDQLVIIYTGNDERTNVPRPPAVPVGELLDAIDATVRSDQGLARDQVQTAHPLQPFDPRNFRRGALIPERAWSFDPATLEGARALSGPREQRGSFLNELLPPLGSGTLELEDLELFVRHPVRAFLRLRLQIRLRKISDEVRDALPVELDQLERWGVGQRLLDARLADVDGSTAIRAEISRGTLPPSQLGEPVVRDLYPGVEQIVGEVRRLVPDGAEPSPADVHVELRGDRLLSGTVAGVYEDVVLSTSYSRIKPSHRLASWVRLLAVSASHPERAFAAATVARSPEGNGVTVALIEPLGIDAEERRRVAIEQLMVIVDLFERGMREPLPLYCVSSAEYARAAVQGEDPIAAARRAWKSEWRYSGEDADREHKLVLAGERALEDLLEEEPREDERGPGWESSETSRFGRLARRMWDGLLRHEDVTDR